MAFLDVRSYDGTPISRRTTDGYVNATAMCKANGKQWKHYRESDRADKYLQALASVAGISVHGLVESTSGGVGGGGTWVHPQVAVDLARWISAPFAVWMDGWFLESAGKPADPEPVAALPSSFVEKVEVAKMLCDMVAYAGGDRAISMARSLTVIGREHPDQKKMCFEQQRLLCPDTKEFVNITTLTEELVAVLGQTSVDQMLEAAKAQQIIKRKDARAMLNKILQLMKFQRPGSGYRNSASWIATEEGQQYSREETRPAQYAEKAWVPQLLWERSSTMKAITDWLSKNFSMA